MPTLKLNKLEFIAYHGYYPEERIVGGKFEVDIAVHFQYSGDLLSDELDNTINYEELFNIVSMHMAQPCKLIETLGMKILNEINQKWPDLIDIDLCIRKLAPAISGKAESSEFIIKKSELSLY